MSPSIQYKHSSDVFSELIDLGVRAKKSSLFLYANMSRVLREAVPTTWYLSPQFQGIIIQSVIVSRLSSLKNILLFMSVQYAISLTCDQSLAGCCKRCYTLELWSSSSRKQIPNGKITAIPGAFFQTVADRRYILRLVILFECTPLNFAETLVQSWLTCQLHQLAKHLRGQLLYPHEASEK